MRIAIVTLSSAMVMAGLSAAADTVPIASLARDDRITISGTVTDITDGGFVLTDATGAVRVDTGPDWFHDLDVAEGEKLTVVGEPDEDEFDAFTQERLDGRVVSIRPADGPPPWAGVRRDG